MKIKNIRRVFLAVLALAVILVFGIGLFFSLTMPYPNDMPSLAKMIQGLATLVGVVGILLCIWCADHIVGW